MGGPAKGNRAIGQAAAVSPYDGHRGLKAAASERPAPQPPPGSASLAEPRDSSRGVHPPAGVPAPSAPGVQGAEPPDGAVRGVPPPFVRWAPRPQGLGIIGAPLPPNRGREAPQSRRRGIHPAGAIPPPASRRPSPRRYRGRSPLTGRCGVSPHPLLEGGAARQRCAARGGDGQSGRRQPSRRTMGTAASRPRHPSAPPPSRRRGAPRSRSRGIHPAGSIPPPASRRPSPRGYRGRSPLAGGKGGVPHLPLLERGAARQRCAARGGDGQSGNLAILQ